MTLEEYFRKQTVVYDRDGVPTEFGVIDHTVRVQLLPDGVTFYIHPANCSGDTADFILHDNVLTTIAIERA